MIPYIPMLVPHRKWKGYDKGGCLFLPSYLMRTHGSTQQLDAVKKFSAQQMQKVLEALDTLGNTKWRVNNRILSVVENIWAVGGNIAGVVNREDVPIPELLSDDKIEIKKWKWSVRKLNYVSSIEAHEFWPPVDEKIRTLFVDIYMGTNTTCTCQIYINRAEEFLSYSLKKAIIYMPASGICSSSVRRGRSFRAKVNVVLLLQSKRKSRRLTGWLRHYANDRMN